MANLQNADTEPDDFDSWANGANGSQDTADHKEEWDEDSINALVMALKGKGKLR